MFTTGANSKNFNQNIKDLIKQGKNDKVKSHMKGMDPSKLVDSDKTSLLHLAAKYNNFDLAKHLIKIKCNVNAKNTSKTTPLMVAAVSSSFKIAQILIEANADIYATNSSNISALNMLLNKRNIPQYLINCCLEQVKSDTSSDKAVAKKLITANCPLNIVIRLKNSNITKMIFNHYGQINPQESRAAMDLALKFMDQINVSILLKFGVEIDIGNYEALSFLYETSCPEELEAEPCLKLISAFLDKVIDWNSLKVDGLFLLELIFEEVSKEVLELFLQHNINDYVKNKFPGQDLFVNIFGNYNADARNLIKDLEFDVNSRNTDGRTALHLAAKIGALDNVQTLLNKGADPNSKDGHEQTPLSLSYGSYFSYFNSGTEMDLNSTERKLIELLLLGGADPQLDIRESWYIEFSPTKLQLMLAQVALNESIGIPIKEFIRQDINEYADPANIYKTCCLQLEKLKATQIHGSITLHTILVEDAAKISDRLRDRGALEAIMNDLEDLHFYYTSRLKNSINRIIHTIDLKMKASTFLCKTTGWPSSQYIILENIISFLTYKDLLVFE